MIFKFRAWNHIAPKLSLGLDSFLQHWNGSFGYCSDCPLTFHWPSPCTLWVNFFPPGDTQTKAKVVAWTHLCLHCRAYSATSPMWLNTCPLVSNLCQVFNSIQSPISFFEGQTVSEMMWHSDSWRRIAPNHGCNLVWGIMGSIWNLPFLSMPPVDVKSEVRQKMDMFDKDTISLKRKARSCSAKWNMMSGSQWVSAFKYCFWCMPEGGSVLRGISMYSVLLSTFRQLPFGRWWSETILWDGSTGQISWALRYLLKQLKLWVPWCICFEYSICLNQG